MIDLEGAGVAMVWVLRQGTGRQGGKELPPLRRVSPEGRNSNLAGGECHVRRENQKKKKKKKKK